jgi:hypothetical protein
VEYNFLDTLSASPNIMKTAIKAVSELPKYVICFSCTFLADSTADGCAVTMENNKYDLVFNATRSNNNLSLLECFSVPEGGEYSVSVHEIHYGVVQEHVCTQVNNITVWITEGMPVVCNNTTKITVTCR